MLATFAKEGDGGQPEPLFVGRFPCGRFPQLTVFGCRFIHTAITPSSSELSLLTRNPVSASGAVWGKCNAWLDFIV